MKELTELDATPGGVNDEYRAKRKALVNQLLVNIQYWPSLSRVQYSAVLISTAPNVYSVFKFELVLSYLKKYFET